MDSAFCMDLAGFVVTLLSSTSGKKQERGSGAGHFAAVPAGPRQCPAAIQEPSGQPAHEPLSLPQPQGNRSLSGLPSVQAEAGAWMGSSKLAFCMRRKVGKDGVKVRPRHYTVSPEK